MPFLETQLRHPAGLQKATSALKPRAPARGANLAGAPPTPVLREDRASAAGRDAGVHVPRRRQRRACARSYVGLGRRRRARQGRAGAAVTEDWSRASRPVSWRDLVPPDAPGPGRARGPAGGAAAAGRCELLPARPTPALSPAPRSSPAAPLLSSPASPAVLIASPHLVSPAVRRFCSGSPAVLIRPFSPFPRLLCRLLSSSTDHAPLRRPLAASACCGPEPRSGAAKRALDHVENAFTCGSPWNAPFPRAVLRLVSFSGLPPLPVCRFASDRGSPA